MSARVFINHEATKNNGSKTALSFFIFVLYTLKKNRFLLKINMKINIIYSNFVKKNALSYYILQLFIYKKVSKFQFIFIPYNFKYKCRHII